MAAIIASSATCALPSRGLAMSWGRHHGRAAPFRRAVARISSRSRSTLMSESSSTVVVCRPAMPARCRVPAPEECAAFADHRSCRGKRAMRMQRCSVPLVVSVLVASLRAAPCFGQAPKQKPLCGTQLIAPATRRERNCRLRARPILRGRDLAHSAAAATPVAAICRTGRPTFPASPRNLSRRNACTAALRPT